MLQLIFPLHKIFLSFLLLNALYNHYELLQVNQLLLSFLQYRENSLEGNIDVVCVINNLLLYLPINSHKYRPFH